MKRLIAVVLLAVPFTAFAAEKAKCEEAIKNVFKLQGFPVPEKIDYSNKKDVAVMGIEKCVKSSSDAEVSCTIAAKTKDEAKSCKGKK